jgi:hypothetical protein
VSHWFVQKSIAVRDHVELHRLLTKAGTVFEDLLWYETDGYSVISFTGLSQWLLEWNKHFRDVKELYLIYHDEVIPRPVKIDKLVQLDNAIQFHYELGFRNVRDRQIVNLHLKHIDWDFVIHLEDWEVVRVD